MYALNLFLKFLYVVPADQVLWNSTENHLFPTYLSWSLSHFYRLNPTFLVQSFRISILSPRSVHHLIVLRYSTRVTSWAVRCHGSEHTPTIWVTRQNYTFCHQQETHIHNHKAFTSTGICIYVLYRAKRNLHASSLHNVMVWFKNIQWKYCTKHVLGSLVFETRHHSQTARSVIWSNHERFVVTVTFRSWLVPFQGTRQCGAQQCLEGTY